MTAPLLVSVSDAELSQELEDWGLRPGADSGQPMMSGRIFHDADGFQVGVWECTPGGWAIENRPDSETVRILKGRARLTDVGGDSVELTAGDVLVLPKGWSGRWDILETVRKYYTVAK
ncbi:MAG TPA: cupin domain-containing protein [Actinomycetes bacterium]|nr:cupin domain-containing protein [Actinomycetes bacterium]